MESEQKEEKIIIVVDSNDLLCPVSFEKYTPENYPVTLECGHTLSYESFTFVKNQIGKCPTCRVSIKEDYQPQKAFLLGNMIQQAQEQITLPCFSHLKKNAEVFCLDDKEFLCIECFVEDTHPKENIFTKEKLKQFLKEKTRFLESIAKGEQDGPINKLEEERKLLLAQELLSMLEEISEFRLLKQNAEIFENFVKQVQFLEEEELKKNPTKKKGRSFWTRIKEFCKCQKKQTKPPKESKYLDLYLRSNCEQLTKITKKQECTALKITFSSSFNFFDTAIIELSKFAALTNLHLEFSETQILDDTTLLKLCKCIEKFKLLTSLHLDLTDCARITDAGLAGFEEMLSNKKSLKTLVLKFKRCSLISDQGITKCRLGIACLFSLSTLHLDFGFTTVTNQSIIYLLNNIRGLRRLETLELDFTRCKMSEAQKFGQYLQHITSLKTLKLSFSKCLLSDNDVEALSEGIKDLKSLISLNIDLSFCSQLTDKSVGKLAHCSKNLPLLENLFLNLNYCFALSDKGMQDLSVCLKNMKGLQNLSLCFIGYNSISDSGVDDLTFWIKSLTSLRGLQMKFDNCCVSVTAMQNLKNFVNKYHGISEQ